MAEYKQYNPANITPDRFFRPPTARTHGELKYLIGQLNQALEGRFLSSKRLLVGAEFEVHFFNPDSDPYMCFGMSSNQNPNYSTDHSRKLLEIGELAANMHNNRPSEFLSSDKIGRVTYEFRTAPQQVDDHLKTLEVFGDLLRNKASELRVHPVVYSQHIHLSLTNNPLLQFALFDRRGIIPRYSWVDAAFSKVTPMAILPEEWKDRENPPIMIKHDGIISGRSTSGLDHTEFRMLSSEYAHDPILNLLLTLRALHESCGQKKEIGKTHYPNDFLQSVIQMEEDRELIEFFGGSTLSAIASILKQYPKVSERKMTIDEVR